MRDVPRQLKKEDADKYAKQLLAGCPLSDIPEDYCITISRGSDGLTIKVADLYGHCHVYRHKPELPKVGLCARCGGSTMHMAKDCERI